MACKYKSDHDDDDDDDDDDADDDADDADDDDDDDDADDDHHTLLDPSWSYDINYIHTIYHKPIYVFKVSVSLSTIRSWKVQISKETQDPQNLPLDDTTGK